MPDSAAFFISYEPGPHRTPIVLPQGKTVYVRAVEFLDTDVSEALSLAGRHMQPGESVMNTHETTEPAQRLSADGR